MARPSAESDVGGSRGEGKGKKSGDGDEVIGIATEENEWDPHEDKENYW